MHFLCIHCLNADVICFHPIFLVKFVCTSSTIYSARIKMSVAAQALRSGVKSIAPVEVESLMKSETWAQHFPTSINTAQVLEGLSSNSNIDDIEINA